MCKNLRCVPNLYVKCFSRTHAKNFLLRAHIKFYECMQIILSVHVKFYVRTQSFKYARKTLCAHVKCIWRAHVNYFAWVRKVLRAHSNYFARAHFSVRTYITNVVTCPISLCFRSMVVILEKFTLHFITI